MRGCRECQANYGVFAKVGTIVH